MGIVICFNDNSFRFSNGGDVSARYLQVVFGTIYSSLSTSTYSQSRTITAVYNHPGNLVVNAYRQAQFR